MDRDASRAAISGEGDLAAPRPAPYPPLAATYITLTPDRKLPNERVLTAGTGITLVDGGAGGAITVSAAGANAQGAEGTLQLQAGSGVFAGSSNLVFLTGSNRLGINTDTPTHSLTIIGNMSASSDVLIGGDLHVAGTLLGGSPLKISGSIQIIEAGEVVMSLGDIAGDGVTALSASAIAVSGNLDVGQDISASYYYGDGSNLTGISSDATAKGIAGSLQFKTGSASMTGSSDITYDLDNNRLTIGGGLVHNRTAVTTSHTASVSDYILGATTVPSSILVDASLFNAGQVLLVKDETGAAASATPVTLNPSGSQTVDGASSLTIESAHGSVLIYSDGSNWFIY